MAAQVNPEQMTNGGPSTPAEIPARYEPNPTFPAPSWAPPSAGQSSTDVGGAPGAPLSSFGAPLASWWQRLGSMLLDALLFAVLWAVALGILRGIYGAREPGSIPLVLWLVFVVFGALYFGILNGRGNGQTPGNLASGIAVRDQETGEPIGVNRGMLRWFVRFVLYVALFIPGVVNDLFPLWDRKRQTIADKAARSVVIKVR